MEGLSFNNLIGLLVSWACINIGKAIITCFMLYLTRGKFNTDNDWKTEDVFDNLNPNTGEIQRRYITKYTIFGVHWGFFNDDGYVKDFSWWPDWSNDRKNRFPVAIKVNTDDKEEFLKFLMRRQ